VIIGLQPAAMTFEAVKNISRYFQIVALLSDDATHGHSNTHEADYY
jgi:hypothetical protein